MAVNCVMFGREKVFKLGLAVVQGVSVPMVAIHTRRSIHNFSVHTNRYCFSVLDEAAGCVKAMAGTN